MWLKKLLDFSTEPLYNSRYKLGEKMASKNYTDEMVSQMVEQYQAEPSLDTVAELAQAFGKTTRSIIAKLSREGVYKAQPRTTKTGEPVVRKDELVAEMATILGIDEASIASVAKATKADLKNLVARLSEVC
tara:strand:+ start:1303 stop:1698 length:396 start_codon:yes stop_codon:yes gene_type:complete